MGAIQIFANLVARSALAAAEKTLAGKARYLVQLCYKGSTAGAFRKFT